MHRIGRVGSILLMAVMGGLISAADGLAQACRGIPTRDGQVDIHGVVGFTPETIRYGGGLGLNLAGPLFLVAGFTRLDFEEVSQGIFRTEIPVDHSANMLSGRLAYEGPGESLSLCPTVGIRHRWGSGERPRVAPGVWAGGPPLMLGELSRSAVLMGLGLGKVLLAGSGASWTFFSEPRVLFVRDNVTDFRVVDNFRGRLVEHPALEGLEETDTSLEFGAVFGAVLSAHRIFGGGDVSASTLKEEELVVSFRIGFIF